MGQPFNASLIRSEPVILRIEPDRQPGPARLVLSRGPAAARSGRQGMLYICPLDGQ